jgi:FkbM family methyltransferase
MWCAWPNLIERRILETGEWEPEETAIIRKYVRPKMTVYDIGANVGYYSLIMDKLGARVHAFEPTRYAADRMRANMALNQTSIILNQVGLLSRTEERTEALESRFSGVVPSFANKEPIRFITLDSYGESPDFIKIDVDGYDFDVVLGGLETIKRSKPIVLAEFNDRQLRAKGHTAREYVDLWSSLGYKVKLDSMESVNLLLIHSSCSVDQV